MVGFQTCNSRLKSKSMERHIAWHQLILCVCKFIVGNGKGRDLGRDGLREQLFYDFRTI